MKLNVLVDTDIFTRPEGAQGYAGQAIDYAGNFAQGTVGTLGGSVKDLGDTVGNAGTHMDLQLGK